jgi:hypothetical protein
LIVKKKPPYFDEKSFTFGRKDFKMEKAPSWTGAEKAGNSLHGTRSKPREKFQKPGVRLDKLPFRHKNNTVFWNCTLEFFKRCATMRLQRSGGRVQ